MRAVETRPDPVAAAAEQREEREEEGGGVHEEIARPDGELNCARGPIPFT
jgi:hypothetical protein